MSLTFVNIEDFEELIKYNPVYIQALYVEFGLCELRIVDQGNNEIEFRVKNSRVMDNIEAKFSGINVNSENHSDEFEYGDYDYDNICRPNLSETKFCEIVHKFTNLVELWFSPAFVESDLSIYGLPESLKILTIPNEGFYKPFMDKYDLYCIVCIHSSTTKRPLIKQMAIEEAEAKAIIDTGDYDENDFPLIVREQLTEPGVENTCIQCKYFAKEWCSGNIRSGIYDHKYMNMLYGYLSTVLPAKERLHHRQIKSVSITKTEGNLENTVHTELYDDKSINIPTLEELESYAHVCSEICNPNFYEYRSSFKIKQVYYN